MEKNIEKAALIISGVAAANVGLVEFVKMDLIATVTGYLTMIPSAGMILAGVIGASGIVVLMGALNK